MSDSSCPLEKSTVLSLYFMEHRAKLIDLAAFLDRVDRAQDDLEGGEEFRVRALREGIKVLLEDEPGRTKRILELFSDHSSEPIPSAGMQGAYGVAPHRKEGL